MNPLLRDACEVAVVGAGPYGLSLAAYLKAAGIETRAFGDPMSFWRDNMPKDMRVRSPWAATHLADPCGRLSLDAYAAARGIGRPDPLSREEFVGYGEWFQRKAVTDLDRRKVVRIDATDDGFTLTLEDGAAVRADRVVVATGLAHQDHRPPQFVALPADLVSHTCEHSDLSCFRDRRVAVVGCGQSGCEGAALLAEAGADVEVITREPIHWLGSATSGHLARRDLYWRLHGLLATRSGVGPFPVNWLNEAPEVVHRLPNALRAEINRLSLRPGAASWLKPRLAGVRIDSGRVVFGARASRDRVFLDLDNGSREFDHVMLATGYRIDIARLDFLGDQLLAAIDRDDGAPILSDGYESSVRGLHFVGASAVRSYGPLLRFVWGAGYAARSVTRHLLAQRPERETLPVFPAPDLVPAREHMSTG